MMKTEIDMYVCVRESEHKNQRMQHRRGENDQEDSDQSYRKEV